MQPSDNTPVPTPAPQPPKQSFWAKLFGKKPETPVVPPHESLAPQPQLDETAPEVSAPAVALQTAAPNTDSIIGNPEAKDLSAPDQNGDVTALPIDVPASIESSAEGRAPSVQTVEQPTQPQPQPPVVEQTVNSQPFPPMPAGSPVAPTPPAETNLPPVQPQQPGTPPPPPPSSQQ
ncbi:MAG: hypothetical protein JWN75_896 [Candidatus Saccharibacteria bacterium]|nr:hypothetical protein [Candidatus Saccharibacteria bacterium]